MSETLHTGLIILCYNRRHSTLTIRNQAVFLSALLTMQVNTLELRLVLVHPENRREKKKSRVIVGTRALPSPLSALS